jgi:hypothetical protein
MKINLYKTIQIFFFFFKKIFKKTRQTNQQIIEGLWAAWAMKYFILLNKIKE